MEENNNNLEKNVELNKYMFKNFMLPVGSNIRNIDYIIPTKAGIFLVFYESTEGKIDGDSQNEMWNVENKNKNVAIKNPIKEKLDIEKIVNSLFISISEAKYKIVIVYPEKTEITEITGSDKDYIIVNELGLEKAILDNVNGKKKVFDVDGLTKIYGYLNAYRSLTIQEKIDHLQKINKKRNIEEMQGKNENAEFNEVVEEKKYLKSVHPITEGEKAYRYDNLNKYSMDLLVFSLVLMVCAFVATFVIVLSLNLKFVIMFLIMMLTSAVFAGTLAGLVVEIKKKGEKIEAIKCLGLCPYCDEVQEIAHKRLVYTCKKCKGVYYIQENEFLKKA